MGAHPRGTAVQELLNRGLDHYGFNETQDAIRCWREVLLMDPGNSDAEDYLKAAGANEKESNVVDFEPKPLSDRDTNPSGVLFTQEVRDEIVSWLNSGALDRVHSGIDMLLKNLAGRPGAQQCVEYLNVAAKSTFEEKNAGAELVLELPKQHVELNEHDKAIIIRWTDRDLPDQLVASIDSAPAHSYVALINLMEKGILKTKKPRSRSEIDFDRLFSEAVSAYFHHDFWGALTKYRKCLELKPDDKRVKHNIKALEDRLGQSSPWRNDRTDG